jgi:polyhydroxybutyrate depolymerase
MRRNPPFRLVAPLLCAVLLTACAPDAPQDSTATVSTTAPATTPATDATTVPTTSSADTTAITTGSTVSLADRPFDVFVPSTYDSSTPMPLVVLLHGYGATGAIQEAYFGLQPLAEQRGFLYVHPDGTKDPLGNQFWNATDACCQRLTEDVDDVGYLMALVDDVSSRYSVDPDRIWFLGHSNGGFMSHRLACDRADRVAAIVSLAGATWLDESKCAPSEPVSVLQIHGTEDQTIDYDDGGALFFRGYPGAETTVSSWARKDACTGGLVPVDETLDLEVSLEGAESTVTRTSGCPDGVDVELWTIVGGAHIPGLSPTFTPMVVDWLFAHPKP